jgi:hypothetical protein
MAINTIQLLAAGAAVIPVAALMYGAPSVQLTAELVWLTHMPTPELRRRAALAVSPDTLIPQNQSLGWPNGRGDALA